MEKATKKSSLKPKLQQTRAKFASARYGSPAKKLKIIAVTGTTGKDIVAQFIHKILLADKKSAALILSPSTESSLSASLLHKYLSKSLKSGMEYVVVEAPVSSIDSHTFFEIPIHMAVLTNITPAQLNYNDTNSYVSAKSNIFRENPHFAVINRDDPSYDYFSTFPAKTTTASFGKHKEATTRINRSKLYKKGAEANLGSGTNNFDVATFVTNETSPELMAAATTAALLLGIPTDSIVEGIASYEP